MLKGTEEEVIVQERKGPAKTENGKEKSRGRGQQKIGGSR